MCLNFLEQSVNCTPRKEQKRTISRNSQDIDLFAWHIRVLKENKGAERGIENGEDLKDVSSW